MDGDPQLFGVESRTITECRLRIEPPREGRLGYVSVTVDVTERREGMTLAVQGVTTEGMATVIGYMLPLALKSHYVSAGTIKRHMWAVFRQLGVAGKEVAIMGCGRPPRAR